MDEKILRILKLVAEGKVTPDEGTRLVASVVVTGAVGRTSPPPHPLVAAVPPAWSTRNVLGIIGVIAVGLGFTLLPLLGLTACFFLGSHAPEHLSWIHLVAVATPVLTPILLLLAIIPGFIAWQKRIGKIAAIGGLTTVAVPILLMIYMLFVPFSK